ncbi:MAG: hypothetical protein N3A58_07015 [Spirochaetes bacterium]|nr:hypothetical protein [Spirochaetota bacterium]
MNILIYFKRIERFDMLIDYEKDTVGYLDITFGPVWDYIPLTRNFIENFLLINLIEKKNISKISLAVSELLENAIKYTKNDVIRLKLIKKVKENIIDIHVFNYSDKKHAETLKEYLKVMYTKDPLEFYLEKMKNISKTNKENSSIGLARINYEAKAKIDAIYDEKTSILETHAKINLE